MPALDIARQAVPSGCRIGDSFNLNGPLNVIFHFENMMGYSWKARVTRNLRNRLRVNLR